MQLQKNVILRTCDYSSSIMLRNEILLNVCVVGSGEIDKFESGTTSHNLIVSIFLVLWRTGSSSGIPIPKCWTNYCLELYQDKFSTPGPSWFTPLTSWTRTPSGPEPWASQSACSTILHSCYCLTVLQSYCFTHDVMTLYILMYI